MDVPEYAHASFRSSTSRRPSYFQDIKDINEWRVSPSKRTLATMDYIQQSSEVQNCHEIEDRIGPQDWGDWKGKTFDEVGLGESSTSLPYWKVNASFRPPKGESFEDVAGRANSFLKEIVNNPSFRNKKVGVITHGEVIRAIICSVISLDLSKGYIFDVKPLSLTHIKYHIISNIFTIKCMGRL